MSQKKLELRREGAKLGLISKSGIIQTMLEMLEEDKAFEEKLLERLKKKSQKNL